jgi:hypothetical protein
LLDAPNIGKSRSKKMRRPPIDALRISPRFTSKDWYALDEHSQEDWGRAADMLKDRLDGRFLRFASDCLRSPDSGFVVLSIDSLLLETLQQFVEGLKTGVGKSKEMLTRFLERERFQPDFDLKARNSYYTDIRCGLLHQAEAKQQWLIRRRQPSMLQPSPEGQGYILDVERFHEALRASMNDYLLELRDPARDDLRAKLWKKMNHICDVRRERGAVYAVEAGSERGL